MLGAYAQSRAFRFQALPVWLMALSAAALNTAFWLAAPDWAAGPYKFPVILIASGVVSICLHAALMLALGGAGMTAGEGGGRLAFASHAGRFAHVLLGVVIPLVIAARFWAAEGLNPGAGDYTIPIVLAAWPIAVFTLTRRAHGPEDEAAV